MDSYAENMRMATEGIKQTLRTLETVISSDPSEEKLGAYVNSLRNVMENYIKDTARLQHNRSLLQEFKRNLAKQEVSSWPQDIVGEFKKLQKENEGRISGKENVKSHEGMIDFERLVAGNIMAEAAVEDEDMEVVSDVQTICPILRTEMRRPVKNMACGHIYEREGIEALMSQSADTRCPVVGCRNTGVVKPRDLRDDHETRKAIANKKKN